ncbi:MAG TPA: hypothetical protein ENN28_03205 [Candidatus Uhrbacteria bacterium]|nr:hypothetical protein [Candidatus Uhrbacteria bacterium]
MPNEHGQITPADFKAPKDKYRITREDMNDGELHIVADIYHYDCALLIAEWLRAKDQESVFFLWDDKGQEIIF